MAEIIKAGDRVRNPSVPLWGDGRVIEISADKAFVAFDNQPNSPKRLLISCLVKGEAYNGQRCREQGQLFRKTYQQTYAARERRAFMDGAMVDSLVTAYPQLFDEDDIRLAKGM